MKYEWHQSTLWTGPVRIEREEDETQAWVHIKHIAHKIETDFLLFLGTSDTPFL